MAYETLGDIIGAASRLPLGDAAEYLWLQYSDANFNSSGAGEFAVPPPGPQRVVFWLEQSYGRPSTSIFRLLQQAQPTATEQDLRRAIQVAANKAKIAAIVNKAAELPLWDAAYYLWKKQWDVSSAERAITGPAVSRPARTAPKKHNPVEFRKSVQEAIARLDHEATGASDTRMFALVQRAHPKASGRDVQQAIQAARKLSSDCVAAWRSLGKHNVLYSQAADEAKKRNPGFCEETYRQLARDLARDLR